MLLRIWASVKVYLLFIFSICVFLGSCKNTPPYTSIAISTTPSIINIGDTAQLTAMGRLRNGSVENITSSVSWDSSNPVTSISPNGLATGMNVGSSKITATFAGLQSNSLPLKVKNPLISISIQSEKSSIGVGSTEKFVAIGTYYNKSKLPITSIVNWRSSHPEIALIPSANSESRSSYLEIGTAKGIKDGTTEISAEFAGLKSNCVNLNVIDQEKKLVFILINPTRIWIDVGETHQFEAIGRYGFNGNLDPSIHLNVQWESSNPNVASILPNGVVRTLAEGRTFLSAKMGDIPYNLTPVFVGRAGLKYQLMTIEIRKPEDNSIKNGQTFRLVTTGHYQDDFNIVIPSSKLILTSSNTNVATVSSAGDLTGLRPGRVTISTSLDEFSNSFTLIVK